MRNTGVCPKCGSRDVVRLARQDSDGGVVSLGWFAATAEVTRHLCTACGFMEQWVASPDDLAKVKEEYLR